MPAVRLLCVAFQLYTGTRLGPSLKEGGDASGVAAVRSRVWLSEGQATRQIGILRPTSASLQIVQTILAALTPLA